VRALALIALVLAQIGPLGMLQRADALDVICNWGWLIGGLAFALALLLGPTEGCTGQAVPPPPAPAATAIPSPLSPLHPLSVREAAVLDLLREGLMEKEIASQLGISRNTVKTHVLHLRQKLGAEDGSHRAILRAAGRWCPPDPPPSSGSPMG
jgi:DNA-binding CsgD family transcriptional regulator